MATLDRHADVSVALALEIEGRAKSTGLSVERYLREVIDRPGPVSRRTRERRQEVKRLYEQGLTDREIAEEMGLSQSGVARLRNTSGLPARRIPRERKQFDPHGHEYTPENTYVNPRTGARSCRECMRGNARKQAENRKTRSVNHATE